MHDPKTVAFEIYLGKKKKKDGNYRSPLVRIWHNDPQTDGTDDSCGWSFPKITKDESAFLDKVAEDQFYQIFAKTNALNKNYSYASSCYDQDTYGVIYWMWRVFNKTKSKEVWQYGKNLSSDELQEVYTLATDPNDNLQNYECNNIEQFRSLIGTIFRSWKRYKRKWYQHPKWHIHHWSFSFPVFRDMRRKYIERCSICNAKFKGKPGFSNWEGKKAWCYDCEVNRSKPNANI